MQIFWRSHDRELNGTLVTERLVGPFSDGADLLYGGDTVVGNENLEASTVSTTSSSPVRKALQIKLTELMTE